MAFRLGGNIYTRSMASGRGGKLSVIVPVILCCFLAGAQQPAPNPAARTVHVFVALADNLNQGIVPVPPRLGNGLDPAHSLYWGAAAGVKTFFTRSSDWTVINCGEGPKPQVME